MVFIDSSVKYRAETTVFGAFRESREFDSRRIIKAVRGSILYLQAIWRMDKGFTRSRMVMISLFPRNDDRAVRCMRTFTSTSTATSE